MPSRSRRAVLAGAVPTVFGLAGCLDSSVGDGRTGTTTRRSTTTDATTTDGDGDASLGSSHDVDGRSVQLVSARTARAFVTLLSSTHPSVTADADRQYVVVELDVSGEDAQSVAADACVLRVDGDVVLPVDEPVPPFTDGVYLAFALSLDIDPESVSLAWRGTTGTVEFTLSERVAATVAAPPAFEVRSFDVPARADGDAVEVSFAVANVGESDGEFLAELGTRALSDQGELRVAVPAGETTTVTRSVGLVPSVGEQTILLDWGSGSMERSVAVPTTTE